MQYVPFGKVITVSIEEEEEKKLTKGFGVCQTSDNENNKKKK